MKKSGVVFEMGPSGLEPSNEVFCSKIRRSRTFVRSAGFGWSAGVIWIMNAVVTAKNKPAYRDNPAKENNIYKMGDCAHKKQGGV